MAHTNSTPNLHLSQFISTDKPTWLGDVNGDNLAIDTAVAAVSAKADASDAKADGAVATAESAASTASDAATLANTANTNATSALTTAGNAATAASAAQSTADGAVTTANAASTKADAADAKADANALKIGDLTQLTTTAKTDLVAAINEVNAGSGGGTAADITYDNTTSGLTATDVQAAIDELAQSTPVGASVEVVGDGVKTIGALLDDLYALIDANKITPKSVLMVQKTSENEYCGLTMTGATFYDFSMVRADANGYWVETYRPFATSSTAAAHGSGGYTNIASTVIPNGNKLVLTY